MREALARHTVVHLEVEPDEAWRRASGKGRPLARDRGRFEQLHGDRAALYESVADALLPPADRDALRRALPALRALESAPAGTRLVWASASSGDYPVFLGRGLIAAGLLPPGRRAPVRGHRRERGARAAVRGRRADRGDAGRGAQDDPRRRVRAARAWPRPAPSAATSWSPWAAAWWATSPASARRSTSAACGTSRCRPRSWRRWTRPTAGRPGVDLPEGKNYAGVVPPAVGGDLRPGRARDAPARGAGGRLRRGREDGADRRRAAVGAGAPGRRRRTPTTILGCLRTKLAVVAEDERDAGRRQVLNLGHTVGHAIEAATGYTRYRHGEAVAIGLLVALRLSGRDAAAQRGGGAARPPAGCRATLRGSLGRRRARARGARQEARRRAGAVRARGGARRGDARATRWTPPTLRAAVEEVHSE